MQKLILLLFTLSLTGCATQQTAPERVTLVSISQTAKLNTMQAWPLKNKGSHLQQVTATANGEKHTFSVYLEIHDRKFEAVAFNDVTGRLYSFTWTPESVSWEASPLIPAEIMPENIIADFLMAHLPLAQLQSALMGASVTELGDGKHVVRTVKNKDTIRKITYLQKNGNIWGHLIVENPQIGYKLDIKTVSQ